MAKSKQGDGSKTDPKQDKEKGKRKVNPQPPPPSAPKKTLCMPPTMNGAVKTRGTATASGSTSHQQPEPASRKVFRLQPPPRRTEKSSPEENVNSSSSQLPATNGSTSQQQPESEPPSRSVFRLQPPPRQTATSPPANHDQQQQSVKLPPYPGLRDPPMEPLPSREVPEVPPLELSENMLYDYDFHFRRILTGTIEGYYRGAWPGWSFIPRDVKKEMFETFKVYYTWPKSREKEVRSVFSRLASGHICRQFQIARETLHIPNPGLVPDEAWDIIRAYLRSPQFRALQEQNKKNRNADGFASTSGYRGGQALRVIDEDAIFDEVAGGTKGRCLGLGNIARAERCGVVDPCSSLTQENQELRATIKSLSQDNEATKAKQMQSDQKLDKLQEYLQTVCAALAQQNINFPPLRILEQVSESSRTTRQQPQQPGPVENSPDKDNNIQDEDLEAHDEENNIG
ncbi:hypothetical protein COLO4_13188 [Corchorus olitorius]|uniref:Transposase, Ptta/En/Spm, plant n=1 Tax=Corchorus olitorius TaxID=93759 RepID=A0A1R3JXM3_9ROSI|nr:hypothetical protein COLO4_13188 [Corchorus olitorius]